MWIALFGRLILVGIRCLSHSMHHCCRPDMVGGVRVTSHCTWLSVCLSTWLSVCRPDRLLAAQDGLSIGLAVLAATAVVATPQHKTPRKAINPTNPKDHCEAAFIVILRNGLACQEKLQRPLRRQKVVALAGSLLVPDQAPSPLSCFSLVCLPSQHGNQELNTT